ncbi:Sec8 exocyst complex component-specific domain-containing protein [Cantharellus anzutake]|uniref:Sec8 exocyst complex component-specific domain-containing protein n=1 Tax=Cantharellus anzutake TaxID=1750568 RepID=UPI0019062394|nr:Sec8 exocyst complex component-specific domain-containing protein [Cantharellus anzutake]KAF8316216.1 Sec8 exocyst complex component-specific domain-containing protein [Cantharellus anzutake]
MDNNGLQELGESQSPRALASVIQAFQRAGNARRQNTLEGFTSDRERERRIDKERRDRLKEKTRRAAGKGTGDIDVVLNDVKDEWEDILSEDFNPVTLALSLLDTSSAGRDFQSFIDSKFSLERALKGSIDKHYKAFAQSLPHHANVFTSLSKTQEDTSQARTNLIESRDALGSKRADLAQLWSRGQALEEMMRLLDQIEKLKAVPDLLESLISEKRLLQAAILLVKSLKMINRPDMLEIGAVSDLRSYLTSQETGLRDILLEELQSHLYLKAFWCDRRWSAYTPNQDTFPSVEFDQLDDIGRSIVSDPVTSHHPRMDRYLKHLSLRTSNESPMNLEDPSDLTVSSLRERTLGSSLYNAVASQASDSLPMLPSKPLTSPDDENPEYDSFTFIESLLEALAVLGKLVSVLDTVVQRLPAELFHLVEKTIEEVHERSDFLRGIGLSRFRSPTVSTAVRTAAYTFADTPRSAHDASSSLRLIVLEATSKESDLETLRDLFWTLFSKLNAVLQGFRVTYEVSNRISSRRDFKDSSGIQFGSLIPLADVWSPVQTEISQLIKLYLRDEDNLSVSSRNPIASINVVLSGQGREKPLSVFKFADTDFKASGRALRKHDDELSKVLKEMVPGLVTGSTEIASTSVSALAADDRFSGTSEHRLLIRPHAFHVTALFRPTLMWLDSISSVLTHTGAPLMLSEAQSILNDFVLNIYLPQLEERVISLSRESFSGLDAFHEDIGWTSLSSHPLVKSSVHLIALVNSLCTMMQHAPFHQEHYARLILIVVDQYYQRCNDRLQLFTKPSREDIEQDKFAYLRPAAWAQKPEMVSLLNVLFTAGAQASRDEACSKETIHEGALLEISPIQRKDNLGPIRNVTSLANLYQSLLWLMIQFIRLRQIAEEPNSPVSAVETPRPTSTPITSDSYLFSDHLSAPRQDSTELRLPLTRAMLLRFDALLTIYDRLSEHILYSVRIDLRCRTYFHLQSGIRRSSYQIDQEASEPDPFIDELNEEITAYDNCLVATLPDRERRFVFEGLGSLMEHILITEVRSIRLANAEGVRKMLRNIVALHQGLRSIEAMSQDVNTGFERARRFYSLFFLGPSAMLDTVRERPQFSFSEYKAMLKLQSGVDQTLADGAPAGDPDYKLLLLDLEALTIGDD